ncbi:hypothetical protein OGAPHI_002645 [Ogataea philodendri]|uniref:Uncharacterized protein n=1 Tax=Ogataea philodendri TaxID=1378263 RepID=A0A9P8PC63_9ASCO|nr:uncharacterized protein OGAPHI_002645 [Ogataea philodendri]KAH3668890.1 hypothetical protein OGAPHI_002645 [Ogataea philodendri]
MTSVPHLDRKRSIEWELAQRTGNSAGYYRKLRHVRTVVVKNVRVLSEPSKRESRLFKMKTKSSVNIGGAGASQSNEIRTMTQVGDLIEPSRNTDHAKNTRLLRTIDPVERQLQLQNFNRCTFLDCFFTMNHFLDTTSPFYISRVFDNSVDMCEDLHLSGLNLKSFTINVYVKVDGQWKFLVQHNVKLSFLVNLGNDLDVIESNLKHHPNLLLLRMNDDNYYIQSSSDIPTDTIAKLKAIAARKLEMSHLHEQPTCSFDQIMKLNNLTICIVDLLSSKKALMEKIEAAIDESLVVQPSTMVSDCLSMLLDSQNLTTKMLGQQISRLKEIKSIKQQHINQFSANKHQREDFVHYTVQLESTSVETAKEKSRIANTLLRIFPIDSNSKLEFSLLGYHMPHSFNFLKMMRSDIERFNALLGIVVLLVSKLSQYLKVPLRYPLKFFGSNSYITDPVSKMQTKLRIYPLFIVQNSNLAIRFEFGLSLLLKNLQQLFESENLTKLDDHDLLANLKVLLTCISSDEETRINSGVVSKDRLNAIKQNLLKKPNGEQLN